MPKKNQHRQQHAARSAYLAQKRQEAAGQFWHGGTPGLEPGALLVSRVDAARAGNGLTHYDLQRGYEVGVTRNDRVYLSTDREFARAWAAQLQMRDQETGMIYQRGTLYRVEPVGSVEDDADFKAKGCRGAHPRPASSPWKK